MQRTLWIALMTALTVALMTGCLADDGDDGGGDDPNPDSGPTMNPDPGPTQNPDPGPTQNPDPGPTMNPDPGPAPDNLDDALIEATEACEAGCMIYAGDACFGEDLPLEDCLLQCDYPTFFADSFDHLEGGEALDCANAFLGLEQCLGTLDCDGATAYFTNADPNADFPCKAEDTDLQDLCPEGPANELGPELIAALVETSEVCRTSCESYAGDACPDGDLSLEECQDFCDYDETFTESFPEITNDQRGLDCIATFTALEVCLGALECDGVDAYFEGDPEGEEDYPCKAEDEAIATSCEDFQ
jgi:hypothetical protein